VARLAADLRFPFVAVAQGSDVHQYLGHPARRAQIVKALNQAGGVVARSGELARLLREAGVAPEKTRVIYNGVDTTVFQPGDKLAARRRLGLSEAAAVVLFVGNFLPIKNPLLAWEAFSRLRRQQAAKLVLLGDGPLRADLLAAAQRARMADDVLLPGRKSEPEVALYLRAADVLCVPSRNEGMPNVILEALASGLPVVATWVGGVPEILEGNPAGRLVPPADGARMATALAETLAQPLPPQVIAGSVRKYSWTESARAYFELLQTLIRGGRPA
jgi:glycosyltransferase involved in cell wall biosynthesis